jgi:hypothetical protein
MTSMSGAPISVGALVTASKLSKSARRQAGHPGQITGAGLAILEAILRYRIPIRAFSLCI